VVIINPVALVAASANPDAAFFLAYLMSQVATKVFYSASKFCRSVNLAPVVFQFEFQRWLEG
jgi:ABC-type Fe3+ transport system substrate-binding protein